MKTAEESFNEFKHRNPKDDYSLDRVPFVCRKDIYKVMDEHAINYAIEFANWILKKQAEQAGTLIAYSINPETIEKFKHETCKNY